MRIRAFIQYSAGSFTHLASLLRLRANPNQDRSLSGMVTSASDGEPLIGVSVIVKGTTNGTVTDFDGKYSLKVNQGQTLIFSYIGYVSQEIKYAG